jgi:hypothetical protein
MAIAGGEPVEPWERHAGRRLKVLNQRKNFFSYC